MAKLDRVTAKVFAASAAANEIGQFGSTVAGSKLETADVAAIQGLSAWLNGWSEALVSGNRYPALQEMNGAMKVLSYQGAYALQEGIPEYDADTTYYIGSIVKKTGTFELYGSLTDDNLGNALSNGTNWKFLIDLANITFTTYTSFSVNSGKVDSDGKPDLLDITDTSKVVFNVDGTTPLKGTLANESLIKRTSIDDLSVTALDDGIYNLFVGESGACVPLANTIFRQRKEPTPIIENSWTQPILSADGTLGGSSFAVIMSDPTSGYNAFKMFDDNSTTHNYWLDSSPQTFTFYNPIPLKVTNIRLQNNDSESYNQRTFASGTVYGSNDNSTWNTIGIFTNNVTGSGAYWDIDLSSNTSAYKYYKVSGIPNTSNMGCQYKSCTITATEFIEGVKLNDIWLNTSIKPYQSKKYNGISFEDFNYIPLPQTVTVATGAIIAKTLVGGYNINGWDEQIMLPDYNYPTTLTNGALFTAPVDGWVKNSTGMFVLYRGSSYTPASTGFSFYPMKGVV